WIRESINSLLPVASIGGGIANVRLVRLQGVPGAQAAASMIVDMTVGVVTQLIFVITGGGLLLIRASEDNAVLVAGMLLAGSAILVVAVAAFVMVQHRGLFFGSVRLARRLLPRQWLSVLTQGASAIDDAVIAAYRTGAVVLHAGVLRLIGWVVGAG